MKLTQPFGGIQQSGTPKTSPKSVTPIIFTCGHWWLRKIRYKFLFY